MLKIAVLSDSHLGFGSDTERAEDAFNGFELALKTALKEEPQPQIILLAGDIFHEKIPRQETLGKAIELFTKINKSMKTKPQILKRVRNGKEEVVREFIPPIIAIWGTHEKRHPDSTNPVQILDKAGLIYCLHGESILVECGYDRIGIHGISGIPDAYVTDALKSWNPKHFPECQNILLIHQNFRELMPQVEHGLEFSDLPKDFITFCGHIHHAEQFTHPVSKKPIIFTGSTVSTQLQKTEAEKSKGFYVIEFGRERYDIRFVPIRTRPFYYENLSVNYKKPVEILHEIDNVIGKIEKNHFFVENEKPIIRIKLDGKLAEGFRTEDLNLSPVMKDYEQKFILSIDKSELISSNAEQHSALLAQIRDNKLSIDEIGIDILGKNLNLYVDPEKLSMIFHHLAEEELELAENIIEGKYEPKQKILEYVSQDIVEPVAATDTEKSLGNPQESQTSQPEIQQPQPIETQAEQSSAGHSRNLISASVQPSSVSQPPVIQPQPQVQKKAPDPTTLHLAETGLSMLGTAGKPSKSSSAPVRTAQIQQAPARKSAPDPTTLHLAESGLSMLGSGSGKSAGKSVGFKIPAPAQAKNPNVVLTQGGKTSSVDASVGLSMLASSDKKEKPVIRVKETLGGQTVSKIAGQPHAKPLTQAPTLRRWKMDEEEEIIKIKKDGFDLKKWLNKDR